MKELYLRLRWSLVCAALPLALALASRVRADEVTLPASQDTSLYENDPGLSNARGRHLFAGENGARDRRRALVQFDVARRLPAGATVTSAVLTLRLSRAQPRSSAIAVHRVTAAWGEGSSQATGEEGAGAAASESDATWSHRSWPTAIWTALGGDFAASSSASTEVKDVGMYSWTSAALVSDVQAFLDDSTNNHGWILVGEAGSASKRFDSREDPAGGGPSLSVTFNPPAATTGACCYSDGSCGISLDPGTECSSAGSYLGKSSTCKAGACPEPMGACCGADAQATCLITKQSECKAQEWQGAKSSCTPNPCPVVLTPFVDPLPVPALATPTRGMPGAEASYTIKMVQLQQKMHRDLPPTKVWGYSDGKASSYPGPTIVARSGMPVDVTWVNDLRDSAGRALSSHPLAVDTCLHGATNTPRTVVHLHGGHVPSEFDGQPERTLLPGEQAHYTYPNAQRAATLWYHDHALGITRLNVIMGLAGFYLVRDDEEDKLGLPSGRYEVGLALQDRSFNPDGSFRYPANWQETFFGNTPVVNGMVAPYLEVDRGAYRLHLLNGSTSRVYTLSLSSARPFLQLGTDGGLLRESISLRELTLAPGERADIVIDFRYADAEETLRNSARSPFPNGGGGPDLPEIMKFKVRDAAGYDKPIPVKLSATLSALKESDAAMTRDLVLQRSSEDHCGYGMWTINGKMWSDVTEFPHLGTNEIWRFVNRSGVTHPMHMHMLFFQVLDRQQFKLERDAIVTTGDPSPPRRAESGWKDTVQVGPFEIVRVIARFEDFEGRYPYHCHLLEHEDHGMMRQFEVKAVCGDKAVARGFEDCDDGNTEDGDGCSATCKHESAASTRSDAQEATPADDTANSKSAPRSSTRHPGGVTAAPDNESSGCSVVLVGRKHCGLGWLLLAFGLPRWRQSTGRWRPGRGTATRSCG